MAHAPTLDIAPMWADDGGMTKTAILTADNNYGRTETDDLAVALVEDDRAEDYGMHSDDRRTCYRCQSWTTTDHVHPWYL
jgi:hypothetical protein